MEMYKETRQQRTVLKNGKVLMRENQRWVVRELDVVIHNGVISEIRSKGASQPAGKEELIIDATDRLVCPGLINAHTHSPLTLAKGSFDRLDHPGFMWRNQADTANRTPEEVYDSAVLTATECISVGTTAIIDNFPEQNFTRDDVEAVVRAYTDVGIRAVIALRVFDREYSDILPEKGSVIPAETQTVLDNSPLAPKPFAETLRLCESVLHSWENSADGRVSFMISPSSPLRCTDEFLREIDAFSQTYRTGVHTHLLESRLQQQLALDYFGETQVEHLDRLNLLDDRLSCAHCIWVTEGDVQLMSRNGSTVVHNPLSNLKLGAGIAPIADFLRSGANVALGTDGSSTNDGLNLLETMKYTSVLHRVTGTHRENWISVEDVLSMATMNGARAMQKESELGVIEVGRKADLVLFDLSHWAFTPLNDPINQLVLCADPRSVDSVFINGRRVFTEGTLHGTDNASVLENARNSREASRRRNGALYDLAERMGTHL